MGTCKITADMSVWEATYGVSSLHNRSSATGVTYPRVALRSYILLIPSIPELLTSSISNAYPPALTMDIILHKCTSTQVLLLMVRATDAEVNGQWPFTSVNTSRKCISISHARLIFRVELYFLYVQQQWIWRHFHLGLHLLHPLSVF